MKMGQTNMHNYMKPLLERVEKGQIDPSYEVREVRREIRPILAQYIKPVKIV
jgi:hypothetical protein